MASDREALLRAAADFLGRRPNATQDEIASAVGVSRATLHRHFAGKPALFAALDELAIAEMAHALEIARLHDDSAVEALRRLIAACQPVSPYLALLYSQTQEFDVDKSLQGWPRLKSAVISASMSAQPCRDLSTSNSWVWL